MSNKTLALIPARAGSKGIKNKNLALLANKPLVYHTIKAAKEATCIDKIVLSSDGDEILTYARSQGIDIIKRPKELALDDTTSDKVILHALEIYKTYENIILLQPTSPFRTSKHIDESFYHFMQKNANALISVYKEDNKILKAFTIDENKNLKGICNDFYPFMPRQKLPNVYMGNGAIYILKIKEFLKNPSFLLKNTTFFKMDKQSSFDIDTLEDLKKANEFFKNFDFY